MLPGIDDVQSESPSRVLLPFGIDPILSMWTAGTIGAHGGEDCAGLFGQEVSPPALRFSYGNGCCHYRSHLIFVQALP